MKKIVKYLSIVIVVIALSLTVYVKSTSNKSVQIQNKEALGYDVDPCFIALSSSCSVYVVWQGELITWTRSFYWGGS